MSADTFMERVPWRLGENVCGTYISTRFCPLSYLVVRVVFESRSNVSCIS